MIPWHVVSGLNGAVMVLPRDGLNDGHGHPLKYDPPRICANVPRLTSAFFRYGSC
jgi:hypothetical protein